MKRDQLVKKYHLLFAAANMLLREIGGDANYTDETRILESIQDFATSMAANEFESEFQEYGDKAAFKLMQHSSEAPEPVPQWDR